MTIFQAHAVRTDENASDGLYGGQYNGERVHGSGRFQRDQET